MSKSWTLAARAEKMNPSVIREILKVTERPGIISFAGGLPSPKTFPIQEFADACAQALLRLRHRVLAQIRRHRRGLVCRLVVAGIDRDRRDEDVLSDPSRQRPPRVTHPERQGGGVIDTDIPVAARQRREVAAVAVAKQFLDRARPSMRLLAPVEQGDVMAPRKRIVDLMRPDEAGAAEDQNAQSLHRGPVSLGAHAGAIGAALLAMGD